MLLATCGGGAANERAQTPYALRCRGGAREIYSRSLVSSIIKSKNEKEGLVQFLRIDDSKPELGSYVDFEIMSHLICRTRDRV